MPLTFRFPSFAAIAALAASVVIVLGGLPSASQAAPAVVPVADGKQDTALLTVTGSAAKMKLFDTRLRALMGTGAGDGNGLGCKHCDELRQGQPVTELVYILPRRSKDSFKHVGTAWADVWYDSKDPFNADDQTRLKLSFDYNDDADAGCPEAVSKCYSRQDCKKTGYCSQKKEGACVACKFK